MFNSEILADRVAREKLERSRTREAERKMRIFDDKVRTIGVDKEGLDIQVQDRKQREEEAKLEKDQYEAFMLQNAKTASALHCRQQEERRAAAKAMVAFRQQQQQPWCRREYDLNDPDRYKKLHPHDAQMIMPGLAGEDPEVMSRRQRQKQQLRDWLVQQQIERDAERRQEELEEQLYNQSVDEMNSKVQQLLHLQTENRKAIAVALKDFNQAKVEEKRRQELEDEEDERLRRTMVDPATCFGVPGLCSSSDKKDPPESLQEVIQFHKHQIEERRRAETEREEEDDYFNRIRLLSARTALLTERKQARLRKQLRRRLDNANAQLAQTHKQLAPDYDGAIDESFFSQFNTCSR
ncbi:unnamed protein product [Ophioblennius macclurei]